MLEAIPLLVALLILSASLYASVLVNARPARFWPFMTTLCLVTSGLAFADYTFADELAAALIVLPMAVQQRRAVRTSSPLRPYRYVFSAFAGYLCFEAVRGLVILQSVRKLRWVFFYLIVLLLPYVAQRIRNSVESPCATAYRICLWGGSYFFAYLLYGILGEEVWGLGRFELQVGGSGADVAIWGTSAYATFPAAIVLVAAFGNMYAPQRGAKWAARFALTAVALAGLYYDSRATVLCLTAFIVQAMIHLRLRKGLVAFALGAAMVFVFVTYMWRDKNETMADFLDDVYGSGSAVWQRHDRPDGGRDLNRTLYIEAGFRTISDSPWHFLFGYGFRVSSSVVGPAMVDLYSRYRGTHFTGDAEAFGTEAFTELLVGTGMLGVALLGAVLISAAYVIATRGAPERRWEALVGLAAITGWLLVINMLDIMLFYLAIMPGGILMQLAIDKRASVGWIPLRATPSKPGPSARTVISLSTLDVHLSTNRPDTITGARESRR